MVTIIDEPKFAVAIDDVRHALIKIGDTVMVVGVVCEDHSDYVQIRFGDSRLGQHLWVPRAMIAVLADHGTLESYFGGRA